MRHLVNITERRGDWLQTFTGKQFWPLDPHPDDIDIRDIAHALANTCRFNGHCLRFYSVAEHSVAVAENVPLEHRLTALLHDAAEAYLADVPRPVKPYLSGYKDIERQLDECIAEKFGLAYPWPDAVHEVDNRILADEQVQLMTIAPAEWALPRPPLGVDLPHWSPREAEVAFACMYEKLSGVSA
ncbi:phosphohydrolase [Methyloceanibacter caenitepidi]|uniref:Predicted hydrolases of HD superfamily n=1 Tax=Methyloceanibacter caenitepidi TaxID=1384459 RepID=A0A0A8JZR9_9HYPH|nr:phosphohydrolase [Methyloceanibacter caenitepidi]BAQ16065.1 predicted hydrolases of HD superfamily [Methyloceanibacter caenitepidi]